MAETDTKLLNKVLLLLKKIPGMEKQSARHSLLSYFPIDERFGFQKSNNMSTELLNILTYAVDLGRLDVLIDAALTNPQNIDNKNDLTSIKKKYLNITKMNIKKKATNGFEKSNIISIKNKHDKDFSYPEYDIFISHAFDDKENLVDPLANMLIDMGIEVWYDRLSLKWGDSISQAIAKGIISSKNGIVVISKNYINKDWTKHELQGLWSLEKDKRIIILPIWYNIERSDIISFDPTLAERIALIVSNFESLDKLVMEIIKFVRIDIYKNLIKKLNNNT